MRSLSADLVVIGGGATGAGVARDAAMRGFSVVLLERADICQGTSARYHGLLHSGGRYVVSDPESAAQCAQENTILKRIHADAIEDTGGLFVQLPQDSPEYAEKFLPAALASGVQAEEISVHQALTDEPLLNPGIQRAFRVADASMDGWKLVWGALESAREYGARMLPYHRVTDILVEDSEVSAVLATDEKTGERLRVECGYLINAAGAWAAQVAQMAGCTGIDVVPGRGIMVGMNQRLVHHVINRCVYPGDGDLLVPNHPISIIGTTDQRAEDPDYLAIPEADVQAMLTKGSDLVPALREARPIHVWAGARPLLKDSRVSATDTRHMSRGMAIISHAQRDGVARFLTIAGGKFTTYRLMAQAVVDQMCEELGEARECRTALEAVPGSEEGKLSTLSDRLRAREADRREDPLICECELVTKSMVTEQLRADPRQNLDDLRRRLRIGMGPCQGSFCASRVASIVQEIRTEQGEDPQNSAEVASTMLSLFHANRLGGIAPVLYGQLLSELALKTWMESTLALDQLPTSPQAKLATGDLALNHPPQLPQVAGTRDGETPGHKRGAQ